MRKFLKSIIHFLLPSTLGLVKGTSLDESISNVIKLPDIGNLQVYLVWDGKAKRFSEALIFRVLDANIRYYICNLRRSSSESTAELIHRVMGVAEAHNEVRHHPNKLLEKLGIHCYKH